MINSSKVESTSRPKLLIIFRAVCLLIFISRAVSVLGDSGETRMLSCTRWAVVGDVLNTGKHPPAFAPAHSRCWHHAIGDA